MQLNNNQKEAIINEYNQWKDKMYANKTLSERQDFGQFFTPPELTTKMLEKFQDLEGSVLDPTCGAGNLLAAAIMAGADPKEVYGIELDPEILEIARNRLQLLGVPKINLHQGNALYKECYEFSDNYNYDDACAAAEKRIAKEEADKNKKVDFSTGFGRFFNKN
jgi:type I restriction-modification system DNA methylase subunit